MNPRTQLFLATIILFLTTNVCISKPVQTKWTPLFIKKYSASNTKLNEIAKYPRFKLPSFTKKDNFQILRLMFPFDGKFDEDSLQLSKSQRIDRVKFHGDDIDIFINLPPNESLQVYRLSPSFNKVPTYVATVPLDHFQKGDDYFNSPTYIVFLTAQSNRWKFKRGFIPTGQALTLHSLLNGISEIEIKSRTFARIDFTVQKQISSGDWHETYTALFELSDGNVKEALRLKTGYSSDYKPAKIDDEGNLSHGNKRVYSQLSVSDTGELIVKQAEVETTWITYVKHKHMKPVPKRTVVSNEMVLIHTENGFTRSPTSSENLIVDNDKDPTLVINP